MQRESEATAVAAPPGRTVRPANPARDASGPETTAPADAPGVTA
ncbi:MULTISPECIES: hypothetical protein [Halorubrum]|nr:MULTISPECIES: hypothetical protein [Halorubrum]